MIGRLSNYLVREELDVIEGGCNYNSQFSMEGKELGVRVYLYHEIW